ncbi:Maf family protein [Methylocystis sp. SB2]|uniref:Maf family protein n=1 Tax=Methylocystis sp. (strain SB2) TaxID=743836 RepID=UPI0004130A41|nr:Maf family protein [Methylocystis sp. SB2]ULO22530.1 Maf family protein [Methylocystis sp. SB2]
MDVTGTSTSTFWRESAPLILASKSAGRRQALLHAGVPFEIIPANVDERAIESRLDGADADAIALALARAKALAISVKGRLVLGADQVASCEGRIFGKPADMREAEALLRFLSGRRHRLHSAIALARAGAVVFATVGVADLTMRPLSEDFVASYLAAIGENALTSAGAYQIEGLGAQLFSKVEGDYWTIMGLPLLELLEALRREGALLS